MSTVLAVNTEEDHFFSVKFADVELVAVDYPCKALEERIETVRENFLMLLVSAEVDDLTAPSFCIRVEVKTDEVSASVCTYRYLFRIGILSLDEPLGLRGE